MISNTTVWLMFGMSVLLVGLAAYVMYVQYVSIRFHERMSHMKWCCNFDYVVDVHIKHKKCMDGTVLTILENVLGLKTDEVLSILDKNGKELFVVLC